MKIPGKIILIILIIISTCINSCKIQNNKDQIIVFCAASLSDVITELKTEFEKTNDINVKLNLASSGTLARQIAHGAPANIFLSANKKWMDFAHDSGLTDPASITEIAGNSLVIIVPTTSPVDSILFQPGPTFTNSFKGRLSIGDPDYVPAGMYAREAMEKIGIYESVKNRLLPAKDVRSALMVVELGETDAGIVYKTDALKSGEVKIVCEIPGNTHTEITYYGAIIKNHKTELTTNFFTFIVSEMAQPIWEKYGFIQ